MFDRVLNTPVSTKSEKNGFKLILLKFVRLRHSKFLIDIEPHIKIKYMMFLIKDYCFIDRLNIHYESRFDIHVNVYLKVRERDEFRTFSYIYDEGFFL